jgi:hypothetical protein
MMDYPFINIEAIVKLIEDQETDRLDLIKQLRKADLKNRIRQGYIRFEYSDRTIKPDSEWQIEESIVLEHATEGTIVIDILKN